MSKKTKLVKKLIGKDVFIRTVTHHFTGRCTAVDGMFAKLEECAWIADDGRLSESMKDSSKFCEVEMYSDYRLIGLGAIVDIGPMTSELPRETK